VHKKFPKIKMCPKYFEKCTNILNIDILGVHSNETGLIRMETNVRITMEADVTIDLCSDATM
jgi:hypothetical protein